MTVGENRRAHGEPLADHALDGEAAIVDDGLDALDRDALAGERGRDRRTGAGPIAAPILGGGRRDRARALRAQQRAGTGGERERFERAHTRAAVVGERREAREAARHAGERRARRDRRGVREVRIDRDQRGLVVVFERGARAAQQHGRRRIGTRQLRDLAVAAQRGRRAAQRVRFGDRARQVERRAVERGAVRVGSRLARHQFDGHAALEAHRHEPAGAERGGGPQRAAMRALDRLGRGLPPIVREPRAVERVRERDRRADAPQQPVFFDEPRRAQVPPAQRRERRVEAGAGELRERLALPARHAGDHRQIRAGLPQRAEQRGPPVRRHPLRRVDEKGRRARVGQRAEPGAPPVGERVERGRAADVRMRDVVRERRGARIDQRVVVFVDDVPVAVRVVQRVLARDAVDDDFDGDAQPVLARAVRQAGERARRVERRRERFGGAIGVRDVARIAAAARRPEAADQHMIEAPCGDALEQRRPRMQWPDETGIAEVKVRRERRTGFHGRDDVAATECLRGAITVPGMRAGVPARVSARPL
ncbi:Uncharacterised protein [Burkholderia pseudomallei]|nr:Uncharacterised protein [Burkholderia pseudomallei]